MEQGLLRLYRFMLHNNDFEEINITTHSAHNNAFIISARCHKTVGPMSNVWFHFALSPK